MNSVNANSLQFCNFFVVFLICIALKSNRLTCFYVLYRQEVCLAEKRICLKLIVGKVSSKKIFLNVTKVEIKTYNLICSFLIC